MTTIKMPQLGESVTEGTIERWLVKEGDTVEQYDPLFEVVTDKVNAEVPSEVAGKVTKILVPDGETVKVGTPLAEVEAAGEETAVAEETAAAEQPAAPEATAEEAPAKAAPPAQEAAADAEAAPPAQPETPAQPGSAAEPEARQPQRAAPPSPQQPTASGGDGGAPSGDGAARMTPAVRRLVREHNVDVSQLQGSGAGGRVTRDDVLSFIASRDRGETPAAEAPPAAETPATPQPTPAAPSGPQPAPAPSAPPSFRPAPVAAPSGGDTEVALSQMRKAIAAKMTKVKQTVPHAYTVVEVDMSNVVRWRERNQAAYKQREGIGISYVAALVKVVTETLRDHPMLNSQFADDRVILKQRMNIGIAVAVDNGLIVPVIHDADQLSISGVNRRIQDLAGRARANKLKLDELQGGTFTVNNTGWFGSVSSMPIINAPEVAILSMEAIVKRPKVIEIDGADVIAIRHMMNVTCSFDHRVLDGAQVGFFLADVRKRLEGWDLDSPLG